MMDAPTDPSPGHRKRCRRYNIPGHFHYLTFSCFRRQPFLARERTRRWLAAAVRAARCRHPFRLVAYVFMPEHVHLLILPEERPYDISEILAAIKQPVSREARKFVERQAPTFLEHMRDRQPNGREAIRFWQRGGGYDRNITGGDELWEKIHYIHQNPVKRKLVARAEEWMWSSAADYAGIREGPLPVDNKELAWRRR